MNWHLFSYPCLLGGGTLVLGLSLSPAIANAPIPTSVSTESNFLNWLRNPDDGEPPGTTRPPNEGDFCVVNLDRRTENVVWSDRPTFIIQGSPRSLTLYRDTDQDPIWEYPVNDAEVVVYTGPPLEPDALYTLRAGHPQFPSSIYEERELRTMSFDEEVQTTANLIALEGETRNSGEKSETAIAILKADYFWQQGLETDAWATLWPLQPESAEVEEAIATGIDAFCNPDPSTSLE